MGLIKGTSITLISRTKSGSDAFNQPIFVETRSTVSNALVIVTSAPEVVEMSQFKGKRQLISIGIPKGDTHTWENFSIVWNGHEYHQIGSILEGISANIPGDWDKVAYGELYG